MNNRGSFATPFSYIYGVMKDKIKIDGAEYVLYYGFGEVLHIEEPACENCPLRFLKNEKYYSGPNGYYHVECARDLSPDLLLIKLMHELKFKYFEFKTVVNRSSAIKHVDIMKTIELLKSLYKKHPELKHLTFKEFFIKMLGSPAYKDFVLSTGYTDYENADTYDTLYNYTMIDIVPGWIGLHISWADLIDKLYNQIKSSHFKFSCNVTSLKKTDGMFEINTQYRANKIIVATTLSGILKIVG